ncbi:MAG: hypothetical protein PHI90_01280 [Clostridia bacterium]|nr:hypothetical protein [Clostridia bacterium]MDD4047457.1 hypothetical protein [Clostridia bacterium]
MVGAIIFFMMIMFVLISIRTKRTVKRIRNRMPLENAADSPLSYLLGELVAVSGGIYLSLVLLTSFLHLSIPGVVRFYGWTLDPLAATAIIIALLQPILLVIYYRINQKIL